MVLSRVTLWGRVIPHYFKTKKTVDKNPAINAVLKHKDEFPQNSIASSPLFLSEQAPLSSPLLYGTACASHYSPGLICPGPNPESRGSQVKTVPSVVLNGKWIQDSRYPWLEQSRGRQSSSWEQNVESNSKATCRPRKKRRELASESVKCRSSCMLRTSEIEQF